MSAGPTSTSPTTRPDPERSIAPTPIGVPTESENETARLRSEYLIRRAVAYGRELQIAQNNVSIVGRRFEPFPPAAIDRLATQLALEDVRGRIREGTL